jgi:hypothetical protein
VKVERGDLGESGKEQRRESALLVCAVRNLRSRVVQTRLGKTLAHAVLSSSALRAVGDF